MKKNNLNRTYCALLNNNSKELNRMHDVTKGLWLIISLVHAFANNALSALKLSAGFMFAVIIKNNGRAGLVFSRQIGCLLMICLSGYVIAQENIIPADSALLNLHEHGKCAEQIKSPRSFTYVEIIGSPLQYSLNFERLLLQKKRLGLFAKTGVGIYWNSYHRNSRMVRTDTDLQMPLMLGCSFSVLKKLSLETGAGVLYSYSHNKFYHSATKQIHRTNIHNFENAFTAGIRFISDEGILIKLNYNPIVYIGALRSDIMHYIGVSVGYCF